MFILVPTVYFTISCCWIYKLTSHVLYLYLWDSDEFIYLFQVFHKITALVWVLTYSYLENHAIIELVWGFT